jgi:putative SbcD/Mre11-related phosphoesterase
VRVHGEWELTPQRVAVHQPTATAVVADLHLGYSEARRRRGDAVPASALEKALDPLGSVLERYGLRRLLIAGDLFEDGVDDKVLDRLLAWLRCRRMDWLGVVPGNHDRSLHKGVEGIDVFAEGYELGKWLVLHGDGRLPARPALIGHFHPGIFLAGERWPSYFVGPRRIVIPAFSPDAKGGASRAWRGYRCLVATGKDVLDFGLLGGQQRRKPARLGRRLRD